MGLDLQEVLDRAIAERETFHAQMGPGKVPISINHDVRRSIDVHFADELSATNVDVFALETMIQEYDLYATVETSVGMFSHISSISINDLSTSNLSAYTDDE